MIKTNQGWTVNTDDDPAWFEHDSGYEASGNIVFEENYVVDYDGIFALPEPVVELLESDGYIVPNSCREVEVEGVPEFAEEL